MNRNFIILDGAMGTQLQAAGMKPGEIPEVWGMQHPDIVERIQRRYVEAGSDVLYTNTFGANRRKLEKTEYSVSEVVKANVAIAKKAAGGSGTRVALDVGPIGALLEPLGTLKFEKAIDVYREIVTAGEEAGADAVIFETFTDLYEMKAAVLAARENTSLPVWATMSFEENGRTFLGTTVESMAVTLEELGVSAIGINCSLGPEEILPIARTLREWTSLPLIIKPNAGLPDPRTGSYNIDASEFASEMEPYLDLGVKYLGGCCGTDPDYIRALRGKAEDFSESAGIGLDEKKELPEEKVSAGSIHPRGICSAGRMVEMDGKIHVIGERINPTGKKRLRQALTEGDMDYVMELAVRQQDAGADILDINVGVPGLNEPEMMAKVVKAVQSVTDLPLQIDSPNADAIEAGLRVLNGRGIVNSVNGEKEKQEAILPVVKKYGAAVIGLTIDENGLPQSADERVRIAEDIVQACRRYGIPKEDILIDCLTMTVSAQQDQAMETLHALQRIHEDLGLHAVLGVSNISFGLPVRSHVTESFLTQAMYCGLDFPIINPNEKVIMDAVSSYRALSGEDVNCEAYITRFAPEEQAAKQEKLRRLAAGSAAGGSGGTGGGKSAENLQTGGTGVGESAGNLHTGGTGGENSLGNPESGGTGAGNSAGNLQSVESDDGSPAGKQAGQSGGAQQGSSAADKIKTSILKGMKGETQRLTAGLLSESVEGMTIISDMIIPALDVVGEKYETGEIFLPQLINAANAACAGLDLIKSNMAKEGADVKSKGTIIVATVQGDIHDIGKNIVKVVLENYGYRIIDLGKDVPPETIVETAVRENVKLIGLSALMTTTVESMRKTIEALRASGHECKVMAGGAVMTADYAEEIGADYYVADAKASVDVAKKVLG